MAATIVVGAFMSAAGKPTAVTGAKAAAGTCVILAVQIAAGGTGIAAAPAGDMIAVGAVPGAEATCRIGKFRALGFLHKPRIDFAEEAGRWITAGLTENQPAAGGGKIQFFLGARDGHIAQTALFLHILLVVAGHVSGEDSVLHAHHKHIGKFQTFGGMDGHHRHAVGILVVAVQIGDQGHFLQEPRKSGVLPVLVSVGLDRADQLAQVFQAGLALLLLCFQHSFIAGPFDNFPREFIQGHRHREIAQFPVHFIEFFQGGRCPHQFRVLPRVGDDLQHGHTLPGSQFPHLVHRGGTDLARRFVDDTAQTHVIPRVDDHRQVGVDILDFLAVKEALTAHNAVRNTRPGEIGFNGVGLGIHTVEYRMIPQVGTFPQMFADDIGNMAGFILFAGRRIMMDLVPFSVFRPQRFALAAGVVLDHTVGRIEDIGGGTVVLLQADGLGAGENLFEVQNVFNGGAAELVDGLVIVAHHADIVGTACQQTHQMELRHAGILVLVHHNVAEFVLVVLPGLGVRLEQAHGMEDQIVKIHGPCGFQAAHVGRINLGDQCRLGVPGRFRRHILRRHQLILVGTDLCHRRLDGQELVINHLVLVDLLQDALLIIRVIDGKTLGEADALGIPAQDPHAG